MVSEKCAASSCISTIPIVPKSVFMWLFEDDISLSTVVILINLHDFERPEIKENGPTKSGEKSPTKTAVMIFLL